MSKRNPCEGTLQRWNFWTVSLILSTPMPGMIIKELPESYNACQLNSSSHQSSPATQIRGLILVSIQHDLHVPRHTQSLHTHWWKVDLSMACICCCLKLVQIKCCAVVGRDLYYCRNDAHNEVLKLEVPVWSCSLVQWLTCPVWFRHDIWATYVLMISWLIKYPPCWRLLQSHRHPKSQGVHSCLRCHQPKQWQLLQLFSAGWSQAEQSNAGRNVLVFLGQTREVYGEFQPNWRLLSSSRIILVVLFQVFTWTQGHMWVVRVQIDAFRV